MTVYLDNAATSWPKPPGVARAALRVLAEAGGNPGRAGHELATRADGMLSDLRRQAASLFGAPGPQHVVFGLNCTDCLNIAIHAVLSGVTARRATRRRARTPHVILSAYEHNSVQRMLNAAAATGSIRLTRVGRLGEPIWRAEDVQRALTPDTCLVALVHASNVTGAIGDIGAVGELLHARAKRTARGAKNAPVRPLFLVDAAQSAGAVPIDMQALGLDLLAMPGHKGLLGPTGTGLLLIGAKLPPLAPWRMGGTGIDSTNPFQPADLPTRLEAGTANTFGLAGLRAALEFVAKRGISAIGQHERNLRARLIDRLTRGRRTRAIRLHAASAGVATVGVLSMDFGDRLSVSDAAAILNSDFGIALRSGLHCAPGAHPLIGTAPQGTLRASPGVFNTPADSDRLA
ncbi:MAG TPA: aminotransferase class V-fold PLP-dependent enzyme, partial [Planctomycetota bacterium]|nr:aminotransferase class V-fold PLP-dependent enzyme [Planctomycetota bacterium]